MRAVQATLSALLLQLTSPILTPIQPHNSTITALLATPYPLYARNLPPTLDLLQTSIEELGLFLANGSLTSVDLVKAYLSHIERDNHNGLNLRAVIQTAPKDLVLTIAAELDEERAGGQVRGPLHGIPLLVKDNMATAVELGMNTSAGNYALQQSEVKRDAEVVRKLRNAGAIILAKCNMNEFAGLKGLMGSPGSGNGHLHDGWSAVGLQTSSAYVKGGFDAGGNPGGSSSGSAVGVSAGFGAAALGSDTGGSVIVPASRAALFGMRPSTGLVSNEGIVPYSKDVDTAGPIAFSTRDLAIILDALTFADGRYLNATRPSSSLSLESRTKPLRLGLVRKNFLDEADGRWTGPQAYVKEGIEVLDVNMDMGLSELAAFHTAYMTALFSAVDEDMTAYLADLQESPVRTLRDLVEWNEAHASLELPASDCCQLHLLDALISPGRNSSGYVEAWKTIQLLGEGHGMGYLFEQYRVDALVFSPELGYSTGMAAALGYVEGTAPMGYCENGLPFGILFTVRPGEEEKLFGILSAYEAIMPRRKAPLALATRGL